MTIKPFIALTVLCLSLSACATKCPCNGLYSTTDDDITTNVQMAIASDRALNDQDIRVRTYERVVTLNGYVANPTQRCVARTLAASVRQVKAVVVNLKIRKIQY